MIKRDSLLKLNELLTYYPVVSVSGPRQSGKSTLLKNELQDYKYITLEDLDIRSYALNDPRGFIETYSNKVIIDEAQYAPELFSYIQTHIDDVDEVGMYVLCGSQNFLMSEKISQSLAGRVGILKLLPFSYNELKNSGFDYTTEKLMFSGFYPRLYKSKINEKTFYENYIETYLERDVRTLKNIENLSLFRRFIKVCANRIGKNIDFADISNIVGIDVRTVKSWLSVLEASYILFLVPPYYNNFDKRIVKSPKLYFYDTGLASYLCNVKSKESLLTGELSGHLFENLVYIEFVKTFWNNAEKDDIYYWRENDINEVDLLTPYEDCINAFEIKKSATMNFKWTKGLSRLDLISNNTINKYVIYNGEEYNTKFANFINWKSISEIIFK